MCIWVCIVVSNLHTVRVCEQNGNNFQLNISQYSLFKADVVLSN